MIRGKSTKKIRIKDETITLAICPICEGKGKVRDKKKGHIRPCVGCKGLGRIRFSYAYP